MKTRIVKSVVSSVMAAMLAFGAVGCQNAKDSASEGKVKLSVGGWATETNKELLERQNKIKEAFEKKYPNVEIVPDTYLFDVQTFMVKASSNQLPNIFTAPYTEINKIIDMGFAKDISENLKKLGWDKYMNPDVFKLVGKNDGIYGVPTQIYAQGLFINKTLFKEAGLVNNDGSIKTPNTYDELAEYAKIIREKTGKAGFAFPTTNNYGGWHFMEIAWSYGVKFMEEDGDGKYKATFDSQECVDAFKYIYDLKWKYNALLDNNVVDFGEFTKQFGTNQAAMMFFWPPANDLVNKYGMTKDDFMAVSVPEGPKGRYSQNGGDVSMFTSDCTPEQIEAALNWIDFGGSGPNLDEESLSNLETSYKTSTEKGRVILDRDVLPRWVGSDSMKKSDELRKKYCNVDMKDWNTYLDFEGVTIRPEEPVCCQELYSVLDNCIQEVITNKNVDIKALVKKANSDFQANYLDNL